MQYYVVRFRTQEHVRLALRALGWDSEEVPYNRELIVSETGRAALYASGIFFVEVSPYPDTRTDQEKLHGGRFYAHEW